MKQKKQISGLSFGNYGLLRRIGNGERLTILKRSILNTGQYIFIETTPDSIYGTAIGLTNAGLLELRKEAPPFPKLGQGQRETECSRCGQPLQLCTGEAR